MQTAPVHIAVLAVGKDAEPTKAIGDLATSAGHKVVARATVSDAQNAVRAQLGAWIEDPNIDVIVISGGVESSSASAAVKPLVSETLPGFTDLFRYLAFQEIGASAMLSNAEAARCSSTFVFVLPAVVGAVRAAMEKLILPQLDAKTTPKNLVQQMPRIQALAPDSAVPVAVVMEKTAGGSGLNSRMPAAATPPRGKPITGANVVSRSAIKGEARAQRSDQTKDDPPTRPIDVAKLEQQIALSESGSTPTKRVDLSRLPKVPPGADENLAETNTASSSNANGRQARADSEPIAPPPPASRQVQHTPTRGSGVVKPPAPIPAITSAREVEHAASKSAGVAMTRKPPTVIPPIPKRPHTEPVAVVPPAKPSEPRIARKPSEPPPPPPPKASESRPTRKPTDPPPPPGSPARLRPPSGPVERVKQPSGPVATVAAAAATSERAKRDTDSAPLTTPTQAIPIVSVPDGIALTQLDEARSHRMVTEDNSGVSFVDPVPETPPAARPDPAAAVRLPPSRPSERDFAALVAPSLSRTTGELPLGEFTYPQKKGNRVGWILALLAMAGLGFAAVVFVVPKLTQSDAAATPPAAAPPTTPPVLAQVAIDAAVAEPVPEGPLTGDAVDPVVEPVAEPTTPKPSGTPKQNTRPGRPEPTPPKQGSATSAVTSPSQTPDSGSDAREEEPPVAPPITDSDCDEVACVLAKYNRPCCEKYRPKESAIKPRAAGGLPTELDKAAVRAAIEKVKPAVVACGEKSPDTGTVKIAMKVKPDGSVSDASIAAAPNDTLGSCVAAALEKAQFAKTVNGGSFTYPFVF